MAFFNTDRGFILIVLSRYRFIFLSGMRLDENREQVLIKTEDEIEDGWDTTQVTVSFSKTLRAEVIQRPR